jgi:plasmid maintenance system killer protein
MMGWKVVESKLIVRQVRRSPREIQQKYTAWRNIVRNHGPYLKGGFRVHLLSADRKGQMAARLNRQWRVIFKVFGGELVVEAIELTPHRY